MFISLVVLGLIVLGVLICSKDKDPVFTELDPKVKNPVSAFI